jgi:hypothetical protein
MSDQKIIEISNITIENIYGHFTNKSGQIMTYHYVARNVFNKQVEELEKYTSNLEKIGKKLLYHSFQKFYFQDYQTGDLNQYGEKETSIDEFGKLLVLNKNKQYQWLFVEAYEEFEIFIEKTYAYLGFKNHDVWPLSDYGNISLTEICNKSFDWYYDRTKKKKDKPHSMLDRMREKIAKLSEYESSNSFNNNLKYIIILFEQMRHVIVHKSGIVNDKKIFIEEVLKKSGLYNDGKYKEEYFKFCKSFFRGKGDYENHIFFLEIEKYPNENDSPYCDVFQLLMNYLLSYAKMIHDILINLDENKK